MPSISQQRRMLIKRPFLFVSCLFCSILLYRRSGKIIFCICFYASGFLRSSSSSSLRRFLIYRSSIDSSSICFFLTSASYFPLCSLSTFAKNSMCLFFFQAVQIKSQSDAKFSSVPHCHQYLCFNTLLIKFELLPPPTQYFFESWTPFSCVVCSISCQGIEFVLRIALCSRLFILILTFRIKSRL